MGSVSVSSPTVEAGMNLTTYANAPCPSSPGPTAIARHSPIVGASSARSTPEATATPTATTSTTTLTGKKYAPNPTRWRTARPTSR